MKNLYKTKRQQGFTIIEVMIVLAVAGLILLIVFLAVPALQRNSRNTQIRNDAAAVLGAVNEYASNNNGAVPGYVCADTTNGNLYIGSGATPSPCNTGTLGGKVRANTTVSSAAAAATTYPGTGAVTVNLGFTCVGAPGSWTANARAFSALFVTEGAGATVNQCTQS